jgi:hypothetical protein
MKCHANDNSTSSTQLPHKFSYIVAILGHNHFESPNITMASMEFRAAIYMPFKKTQCSLSFIVINVIIINFDGTSK